MIAYSDQELEEMLSDVESDLAYGPRILLRCASEDGSLSEPGRAAVSLLLKTSGF